MAQEPTGSPEDSGPPQSCPGLCRTPLCLLTWEGLSQVRTRGGCQGRAASEWGPWQAWEPQSPFRSPLGADELSCGFLASRAFFYFNLSLTQEVLPHIQPQHPMAFHLVS